MLTKVLHVYSGKSKSSQPAYDVDKVVEQLNELKEYDVCANISCETCSYTGQCWEGERGQKVAIDRAVEIAKGGGIEW